MFKDAVLTVALFAMSALTTLSNLAENIETTMSLFSDMRDKMADEEWERLCDHPLIGPVLDSLSDLEYTLGQ